MTSSAPRPRDAGPDRDVDLLVIEPRVADRFAEIVRLPRVLAPLRVPADVVVVSQAHVDEWGDVQNTMLHDALREDGSLPKRDGRDLAR